MIGVRSVWLGLGTVLTVATLFVALAGVWELAADAERPSENTQGTLPFDGGALTVEVVGGDVNLWLMPGDAGRVMVDRVLQWSAAKPVVKEEWDGGKLRLILTCPGGERSGEPLCQVDYRLGVPPETAVQASIQRGSIDARWIYGALRLTTVSGDIRVSDTPATVWARTGTGSVNAHGLRGDSADVEVGTGQVSLSFEQTPRQVRAVVRADGDAHVNLPDRGPYAVDTKGRNIDVNVDRDANSPRKILVHTFDGDVTIAHW
ncbi:DUF4097 family beta strand repeat-containing protein [Nonomuraea sp. NPDC046570]|uniref:DUF4097 family beta strand repeat-containing protein n=1 Tax=Nonomuraea sp. NPDC046570 TaxID=3155255 RepID=UPI0034047305